MKLKLLFSVIRNIVPIVRFHFHYFPFSQALKLPVFLNHAHLRFLKGSVKIEANRIHPGMIRLGYPWTCMKQNKGFHWLNSGGVILSDNIVIANDSVVEIGKKGILKIGTGCHINGGVRLSCQKQISLGANLLISWDVAIYDTDFHRIKVIKTDTKIDSCSKSVVIADNCWLGFGVTLMKGAKIGQGCIVGAKSVLAKDFSSSENTIFVGNPAVPITRILS